MGLVMAGVVPRGTRCSSCPAGWVADRLGSKPALIALRGGVVGADRTGRAGRRASPGLLVLWGLMGGAQAGHLPVLHEGHRRNLSAKPSRRSRPGRSRAAWPRRRRSPRRCHRPVARAADVATDLRVCTRFPGLVWAVAFALVVPATGRLEAHAARGSARRLARAAATGRAARSGGRSCITDRQMLLLCSQQFLRAGGDRCSSTPGSRDILQETKGSAPTESGSFASWPPLVGDVRRVARRD